MEAKLKSLFHKMPIGFQRFVIQMVNIIVRRSDYHRYHKPYQRKILQYLKNRGYRVIKPYKVNTWKRLPIFTQYFTAEYKNRRVFCKFSIVGENYGCIKREAVVLQRIRDEKNVPVLQDSTPVFVDYINDNAEKIEGVVYQYIDDAEVISDKNIRSFDDIKKLDDLFWKTYKEMGDIGLIHGDIRPMNVLRNKSDGKLVIIDFGMSYLPGTEGDPIYNKGILPYALRNTGCGLYNPKDGVFDDAYSFLKTLKDVYFDYKKDFKENWIRWNKAIGKREVKLEIQKNILNMGETTR